MTLPELIYVRTSDRPSATRASLMAAIETMPLPPTFTPLRKAQRRSSALSLIGIHTGKSQRRSVPPWAIMTSVRVATWNVNSVRQRIPRLLPWLDERRPDVVCLQETKLTDGAFVDALGVELRGRGYEIAHHGEAQWNGVAILSRAGLDDVEVGIPGGPGFPHQEARAIAATCGGVRVHSVYVPNGRVPDLEHYPLQADLAGGPSTACFRLAPAARMVCGDMNIAPTDADVFDPDAYRGETHASPRPNEARLLIWPAMACTTWSASAGREFARLHVLGLPGRHVSPGPRHAEST